MTESTLHERALAQDESSAAVPARVPGRPHDWPGEGPIDLEIHDLPHPSASIEWWYVHSHLETLDGRSFGVFASFFRFLKGRDESTKLPVYAHSLTWAISDCDASRYHSVSLVDPDAVRIGKERLQQGMQRDTRLRRALQEVLDRGSIPLPDRRLSREPMVRLKRLDLDFDGNRFHKDGQDYVLELSDRETNRGCRLRFQPSRPAFRHGDDGLVKGVHGEDMFYYCISRCAVVGSLVIDGHELPIARGSGWYDHEFGGQRIEAGKKELKVAWTWCAVQLADGRELSAYTMSEIATGDDQGSCVILIDGERRSSSQELRLEPLQTFTSTRTFNDYPSAFRLVSEPLGLDLRITACFPDQEFITLLSKSSFWEGRCRVEGQLGGRLVDGWAYIERSGYSASEDLREFFDAVGKVVRRRLAEIYPLDPTYEEARRLIASPERDHYMRGIDLQQFARALIKPVREITDRGGKSWRSYAAFACCDVVGGDSRKFIQWLALPELLHVGALIIDDIQDRSTVRRSGPACHSLYGEAIAINAGTAAYFMGQKLFRCEELSDRENLRLYDFYFEALRAGHTGQAIDLDGLQGFMPEAVEKGDSRYIEPQVMAYYLLKTAAPVAALVRIGALLGGGTDAQIEGVGRYFEDLGMAFQIVDDLLNLRGFEGTWKNRGEDVTDGKVTLPVAKAIDLLPLEERRWLWDTLRSRSTDEATIEAFCRKLVDCGAIEACERQAQQLVDEAWQRFDPLVEDSLSKIMLRAFSWYLLERTY